MIFYLPKLKIQKVTEKVGLPPGTLAYVGKDRTHEVDIDLIDYNLEHFEEKEIEDARDTIAYKKSKTVSWININGLHNLELFEQIGEVFELHPLVMEDMLNTQQRPKVEDYEEYIHFTLKMLSIDKVSKKVVGEQVSFILGNNYVISFQEQPGDIFEVIRDRIREAKGKIRSRKADYLFYRMIDIVVDHYFIIFEALGEELEVLEEEVLRDPNNENLLKLQHMKRQLITLRKSLFPLREAVMTIKRDEPDLISKEVMRYFSDVYDHIVNASDSIETYRDILSGIIDIHMTAVGNRMNTVMKVLTVIATIFIPLTFVAGVYGMNFEYMPELHYKWGYPVVMGTMLLIALCMLIYFKRKKWL